MTQTKKQTIKTVQRRMPSKPLNSLNKSDQQDKKKIDIVKLILNKRKQETSNRKHAGAELLSVHSFSFID
tara:strand:+ start:331 stop:540 length:210 start_codon:yes stop_codon:yes gene_type:complete